MTRDEAKQRVAAAIIFRLQNGMASEKDALDEILTLLEVLRVIKFDEQQKDQFLGRYELKADAIVLRRYADGSESYGDRYRLVPLENNGKWQILKPSGGVWEPWYTATEAECRQKLTDIFDGNAAG